jgi:type 2A phosphatase activator TIP41
LDVALAGSSQPPIKSQRFIPMQFASNSFQIKTEKRAIWNAQELLENEVKIPFPEMFYGNNYLVLTFKNGEIIRFTALDALNTVDATREGADRTKVAIAQKWTESRYTFFDTPSRKFVERSNSSLANHSDIQNVVKPYDWTYTCNYSGTLGPNVTAAPG